MEYEIVKLFHKAKRVIKIYNVKIEFYTTKQIKEIYPVRIFRVIGQIGNKTVAQIDTVKNSDGHLIPFSTINSYNKFTEAIVGYVAVDKHTFISIIKNVFAKRMAIFLIAISLLTGGILALINFQNWFG